MGKFLDGAKKAGNVGKKGLDAAQKTKHGYDKATKFGSEAYNDGIEHAAANEAKDYGKKKGTQQAKKLANNALKKPKAMAAAKLKAVAAKSKIAAAAILKAKAGLLVAKGVFVFLITPPIGWIVSGFLLMMIVGMVTNASDDGESLLTRNEFLVGDGEGHNDVTFEEYAALQNGCPPNLLSGGPSSALNFGQGRTDWDLNEVVSWMSSPIETTWGVDLGDAEALFLRNNRRIAATYGVTDRNIREVSNAVQSEGVAPQFFWMYSVEEGGGHGGYINHFTVGNASTDRLEAARNDARKIREIANDIGPYISTGGGITPSMPIPPAVEILDMMPSGTIGRAYLKMTAAATAEIVHLNGRPGAWSPGVNQALSGGFGTYGPPLGKMMTLIQQLNGDPFSDAQMTNVVKDECWDETGDGQLVSGGMTHAEAREFMYTYYNANLTSADIRPAADGVPFMQANCTAFISWFLNNYTDIRSQGGNGVDIVPNLVRGYDSLEYNDVPTVYGVFSVHNEPGMTSSAEGHAGIILGIDTANDEVIVGQANYNQAFRSMDHPASGVNVQVYPLSYFEGDNWTFVDISEHLTF